MNVKQRESCTDIHGYHEPTLAQLAGLQSIIQTTSLTRWNFGTWPAFCSLAASKINESFLPFGLLLLPYESAKQSIRCQQMDLVKTWFTVQVGLTKLLMSSDTFGRAWLSYAVFVR